MTGKSEEVRKKEVRDYIVGGIEGDVHTVTNYGAFMFQGITTFLYENAYEACKEYVSNAADAEAKIVRINCVPPDYDTIVIVDNGEGMTKKNLLGALDIYISTKRKEWNEKHPKIGHFGVGIYAGTMLCDYIHIRTKQKNSSSILELTIPVKRWLDESETGYDLRLEDVLHFVVNKVDVPHEWKDKSFTTVILEGVGEEYRTFFKDEGLSEFTQKIAGMTPIGFEPNLNLQRTKMDPTDEENVISETWDFSDYIEDVLNGKFGNSLHGQYNNVNLFVNGIEVYRPHPNEPLSKKHVFETSFKIGDTIAGIGWAVAKGPVKKRKVTKYGVFKDHKFQGIDVRLLNVPIYTQRQIYDLVGLMTADMPRRNIWGEIYLFHPSLQATLPRKGLKPCSEWIDVKGQIREWLDSILNAVERARRPPIKKRKKKKVSKKAATPSVPSRQSPTQENNEPDKEDLIEHIEVTTSNESLQIGSGKIDHDKLLQINNEELPLDNCSNRERDIIQLLLEKIVELGIGREKLVGLISVLKTILSKEGED